MSERDGAEKPRQPKHLRSMVATALAAAVPLLGASLGVSAAPTPDDAGPAASAKSAVAGKRFVQSNHVKYDKSRPDKSRKTRTKKGQALYKKRR